MSDQSNAERLARLQALGLSQGRLAVIATAYGAKTVFQTHISRWATGENVGSVVREQIEKAVQRIEQAIAFYAPLEPNLTTAEGISTVIEQAERARGTDMPSAMAHWRPGGNVARSLGTPSAGVIERSLATE